MNTPNRMVEGTGHAVSSWTMRRRKVRLIKEEMETTWKEVTVARSCLETLGKQWKTPARTAGVPADIRTKHSSNTSLASYYYPNPHGNSMKQSPPWEADSRSATKRTAKPVWNLKSYYRVHKKLPMAPILSQINPVHTLSLSFSLRSILLLSSYLRPCLPRVRPSLCNFLIIMLLHHT
jgi:hypothetical protein